MSIPKNVYVGKRYVPKQCGDWNNGVDYESLSVVLWQGASYTSKQDVPRGIDIGNIKYWVRSADYNAQVAIYEQNVRDYHQYVIDQILIINENFDTFKEDETTAFESFKNSMNSDFQEHQDSLNLTLKQVGKGHISNIEDKVKGASMILPYIPETYGGTYQDFIDNIVSANCNLLSIAPRWWLVNETSRITGYNGGLSPQTVYDICVLAKQKGLKVMLKPHMSGDNFTSYASINPLDVTTFLNDYKSYMETLMIKCKDVVDYLSLTNEMDNQTKTNKTFWETLISSVRSIAPNVLLTNSSRVGDLETNVFLDKLDILGCNMYVGIVGDLTTDINKQRASMFTTSDRLNTLLRKAKELNQPIIITEVGLQPYLSSLMTPEQWIGNDGELINYNAQIRYYNVALREYLNASNVLGTVIWTGFDFIGKPSFDTVKEIYGGGIYE